jgi:hypothetical protein
VAVVHCGVALVVACQSGGARDVHSTHELIEEVRDGQEDHQSRRIDNELPAVARFTVAEKTSNMPGLEWLGESGECEECEGQTTHSFGGLVVDKRW